MQWTRGGPTHAGLGDSRGQTITEYALILAGVGVVLIVSLLFLGGKVGELFHRSGSEQQPVLRPPSGMCDPNYAGACLPPPPPDLDCADLRRLGIRGEVRVVGSDPHNLDPDHDGVACD